MRQIKSGWFFIGLVLTFLNGCPCPAYEYPQVPKVGNFVRTIIMKPSGIQTNETLIPVASVSGLPAISSTNEYFYLVLLRTSDGAKEIVKVTAVNAGTKTLTVVRGQDGTVPLVFSRNDRVELWVTAGLLEDYRSEQRGYIEQKSAEGAAGLSAVNDDVSNIITRLSGVVGTNALNIAAFDPAGFESAGGKIKLLPLSISADNLADQSITAEKIDPEAELAPFVTIPPASTAVRGTVQLATQADVNTGTNTEKAVTPAQLKGSQTSAFSPVSYDGQQSVTLPTGLTFKFGRAVADGSNTSIDFLVPFPSAIVSVLVTGEATNQMAYDTSVGTNRTVNGFNVRHATGATHINWFAIGY